MFTKQKELYYEIFYCKEKYLADALSFLGFKYYKFTDPNGSVYYSFENSDKLNEAMTELLSLQGRFSRYGK